MFKNHKALFVGDLVHVAAANRVFAMETLSTSPMLFYIKNVWNDEDIGWYKQN